MQTISRERHLKLAALLIGTVFLWAAAVHADTAPSLVSLWHGEGDASDSVGTNHGVLVGGVGFVPGVSGQAFRLDGNNFIHIENSASLRLTNALTVQMWFRNENPAGGILFDKRNFTTCSYGAIISTVGGVGLELYYQPGSSGYQTCLGPLPSSSVWHHFAGTYQQRSNGVEMTVYLDGVAVQTNTRPGTLAAAANTVPLAIGAGRDGADTFFTGAIDEVAIYNYALSAAEVLSNYSSVIVPLAITSEPHDVTVQVGQTATFSVGASGALPLSYQWHSTNSEISGASVATLTISNVQSSDAGGYFVVVSDGSGSVTSAVAVLTIALPPTNAAPGLVSLWHGEGDASDSVGTNHGVLVGGVGFVPGVSGQAFRLDGNNFIHVENSASLRLTNALTLQMWFRNENPAGGILFDKRNWTSCSYGAIISTVGLVGLELYYQPGSSGYQTCLGPSPSSSAWHHFAGTYQQRSNGVEMTVYLDGVAVQTNTRPGTLAAAANSVPLAIGAGRDGADTFFTGAIDEFAIYNYALNASEVYSNYSSVALPLAITSEPHDVAVQVGDTATFSVSATGALPLNYQWHSTNGAISGASTATLTISNVQSSDSGDYFVVVSDASGSVTSVLAALTIAIPPTNTAPSLVSLWHGEGDASDSVGTNHGVLVGGVGFVPGVSGQAFRLDGNNFIHIENSASLRLTNALTVQMWFRNENPAGGILFDKRNFTTCSYGAIISTVGLVGLELYYQPASSGYQTCLGPLPSSSAWHHFVGTYQQRTNGVEMTVYLDGVAVQTNTRPGTLAAAANSVPLAIGAGRDGADTFFTGAIDEVAIYNYALNASEVYSNYSSVTPPATDPPPVVTPALVSLWHGEEDATDSVGTNHGVLVGGVGFVPGVSGQAFRLDGNNFIHIENSASLRLTNALTVQMWFRNENPAGGILFDKRNFTTCSYGAIISTVGGVGLELYYQPGSSGYQTCLGPLPSSSVWHHFAGTYQQRSNGVEMTVYLDGVAVQTNTRPGTLAAAANTVPLAIGAGRDGADTFFTGAIDEVAIYNYALSAAEVYSNYFAIISPPPPPSFATISLRKRAVSGPEITLNFVVTPTQSYAIEVSEDLDNWIPLITTNATGSSVRIVEPNTRQFERRFYRARPLAP